LIVSTNLEVPAIIRILEKNGLITSAEVLEDVSKLKEEMEEKIRRMGRENWG